MWCRRGGCCLTIFKTSSSCFHQWLNAHKLPFSNSRSVDWLAFERKIWMTKEACHRKIGLVNNATLGRPVEVLFLKTHMTITESLACQIVVLRYHLPFLLAYKKQRSTVCQFFIDSNLFSFNVEANTESVSKYVWKFKVWIIFLNLKEY